MCQVYEMKVIVLTRGDLTDVRTFFSEARLTIAVRSQQKP